MIALLGELLVRERLITAEQLNAALTQQKARGGRLGDALIKARAFAGSHPRDLVEQIIDRARFLRQLPALTIEAIDAAAATYFVDL